MNYSADKIGLALKMEFSKEQVAAIESDEAAPALIEAGAGSGKTAVMAARVVYLIANGIVKPEQVLGLTYTNLATGELASRVREHLSDLGLFDSEGEEPLVKTYHSFASHLVTEYGLRIGLEPDLAVMPDARRAQLAADVLRTWQMPAEFEGSFNETLKRVMALDDELSNCDLTTEEMRVQDRAVLSFIENSRAAGDKIIAEVTKMETASKARLQLADLIDAFRERKRERELLDYADMSRFALRIVREVPEVVAELRDFYRAVFLDEYQDTSIAQRRLMQTIFGAGHPVTAVGDPMQCIFAFNGSSPANIDRFPTDFPNADGTPAIKHDLKLTHRNGPHIVQAANTLTAKLRNLSGSSELVAAENNEFGPGRMQVASFETSEAEMDWLAERLREVEAAGTPLHKVAVLLRGHKQIAAVHRALVARGLSAQVRGKRALLEVGEVAELLHLLRAVAEPAANVSWVRLLTSARWQIGQRDLVELGRIAGNLVSANQNKSESNQLEDLLEDAVSGLDPVDIVAYGDAVEAIALGMESRLSPEASYRVRELHREINYLRAHAGEPVGDLLLRAAKVSGLWIEAHATTGRLRQGMAVNLRSLLQMADQFVSLEGDRNLFAFLDWLADAERFAMEVRLDGPVHQDSIQVMTAHSAKGLQFNVVAMPYLADDIFPSSEGRDLWVSNSGALPQPLRDEPMSDLLQTFPLLNKRLATADFKDWTAEVRQLDELDERRLAYVSATRTRDLLLVSTNFAIEGETKSRPTSIFFDELLEIAQATLGPEVVGPLANPPLAAEVEPATGVWPQPLVSDELSQVRALAGLVSFAIENQVAVDISPELQPLQQAVTALLAEAQASLVEVRQVPLPSSLSTTKLMQLNQDEETFLKDLLRPMPLAPAPAANVGTDFHAWLEADFRKILGAGKQLELPYADFVDDEAEPVLDSAALATLKTKWLNGPLVDLVPVEVELPFILPVGELVIRGKIDAVFSASEFGRKVKLPAECDYVVVDWKTGKPGGADALQLAVYRLAVAQTLGCNSDRVQAAFYYVSNGDLHFSDQLLSVEELATLIGG